jgi:hypothetical protein
MPDLTFTEIFLIWDFFSRGMGPDSRPYPPYWEQPRFTPSLRELEQLRVLAMSEFDPPLSSQELVGALRACNNRTDDALRFLKGSRRHRHQQQRSVEMIPSSAPAASTMTGTPEREHEKRRLSQSSVDDMSRTPSKRRKDLNFLLEDMSDDDQEEKDDTDAAVNTQQDVERLPAAADCCKAQQILLQTVEDRVAARHPPRNPDWINEVWKSLNVPAVLELAMHLNLTVDALAKWVQVVDAHDAQGNLTRGAALTVEVAASLPRKAVEENESVAYSPKDEVLAKKDEEVASVEKAEAQAAEMSAYARANEAKNAIERLSSACEAYMDRLGWFARSDGTNRAEKADVEKALETLGQKLAELVDECTCSVKEAQHKQEDAKQTKETRSAQIVDFVQKRQEELVRQGETEASASLQSVVDVWKNDDVEVQALWSSRRESEERVAKSAHALKVADNTLRFYKNVLILFDKVRSRRAEALAKSSKCFEEARATSEARATVALDNYIPMLTRALCQYYKFHSIQQAKAKEELEDQEKALAEHNEYFGDSAPIKKGDIERRIQEFMDVTQSSMQRIMEIAEGQQQLWEAKQAILPESVRLALIREFKALWLQLSGPMKDVMRKFVATIEEAGGGAVAVEPAPQAPLSPVFVAATAADELEIPTFTLPSFENSQAAAITVYRTAISPIVAPNEVTSTSGSPKSAKEPDTGPASDSENAPDDSDLKKDTPTDRSETRGASAPSVVPGPHEFAVGSVLYSKMAVGDNCVRFFRGVVQKHLANDSYLMQYDNGDEFSVHSSFLFTKDLVRFLMLLVRSGSGANILAGLCWPVQMEQNLKASGSTPPDQDTEMEDAEPKPSHGGCAMM